MEKTTDSKGRYMTTEANVGVDIILHNNSSLINPTTIPTLEVLNLL